MAKARWAHAIDHRGRGASGDRDRYSVEVLIGHVHERVVDGELADATTRSYLEKTLARLADWIGQTGP